MSNSNKHNIKENIPENLIQINVGEIYYYSPLEKIPQAPVTVIQHDHKRQRTEVSRDLENKTNGFWVNSSELLNNNFGVYFYPYKYAMTVDNSKTTIEEEVFKYFDCIFGDKLTLVKVENHERLNEYCEHHKITKEFVLTTIQNKLKS